MEKKLNENPLPDDFLVYWDHLYVADGKVICSDIKGTIRDLKMDLKKQGISCEVITDCDIWGRTDKIEKPKENEKPIEKPVYKPIPRDPESYFIVGKNRILFKKIEWYEDNFWNNVIGVCGSFYFNVSGLDKFSPKKWISDQNYGNYFTTKTSPKVDLTKLTKINLED